MKFDFSFALNERTGIGLEEIFKKKRKKNQVKQTGLTKHRWGKD